MPNVSMGKITMDDGRRQGHLSFMENHEWRRRLKAEIELQDKKMKEVSLAAGAGATYVRDAIKRGRGKAEYLERVANVLGVSYEWLRHGRGDKYGSAPQPENREGTWRIPIIGDIAAGTWREPRTFDVPLDKLKNAPFPPDPRYLMDAQYDLVVRGESLNQFAQDGMNIRCVDCEKARIEPKSGDLVVVKRVRADGDIETTAKRLFRMNGTAELRPETDDPRWKESIRIDKRSLGDGTVSVTAIVLYAYRAA